MATEDRNELQEFLVTKFFDPESLDHKDEYLSNFDDLTTSEERVLANEPGRFVVVRELTPVEVEEVLDRPHIYTVEPNFTGYAPPQPEMSASASEALTAAQVRKLHGIDKLHAAGVKGKGQKIAVIDTGISEELANRLGKQVVSKLNFTSESDWRDTTSKHGTWIISVVAAACPEAEIMAIKALRTSDGSGTYSGIIEAIEAAKTQGATHINLSLGGPVSVTLDNSVNSADLAGILVAVAAGNSQRGSESYTADNQSPARAERAITTAAARSDLIIAEFSSWGMCVDISALGVSSECADPDLVPGFWNGTSMAAPYIFIITVLLSSAGAVRTEIKKGLYSTATNTGEPQYQEGAGFANAYDAYVLLKPQPAPPSGYFPGLKRVPKTKVDEMDTIEDFVMTYRRKDVGVFRVKPMVEAE